MTARFLVADVFDGLASLETGSVDVVITSPPFLALRSYLPADHELKGKEIGSEATPAEFIDTLLKVTAELRRVLAPHGSICVELGDTYAGSSMSGGDDQSNERYPQGRSGASYGQGRTAAKTTVDGWPLAKSRTLIPSLYQIALAYGFNPLTGSPSPAGQWRIRNIITWARPNPPVGALGDKWRPATSDLIIACTSGKRYWDDLATRKPHSSDPLRVGGPKMVNGVPGVPTPNATSDPSGAPLLDYWVIPPGGYSGQVATEWKRPVDRRESVGDIRRTTSADCPEHGDQVDPPATGSHGEPVSALQSPHNSDNGESHVQGQLLDSAPIDPTLEPATVEPNSDSPVPQVAPSAKPRSKASNRTAPAPATSPPDTPSEETTHRTDGKPTSPSTGEHHPDTDENRTSSAGSPASPQQTTDRTPDTDTPGACTCSYYVLETKFTSHYAVFPEELVVPCVKAMCPERVCRVCGEPSRRIVDRERVNGADDSTRIKGSGNINGWEPPPEQGWEYERSDLGWSDCGHDTWRPGLVLDPFAGSGTTLAVATGHGHDAVGIDLDSRNADLARDRVGPFLFEMVDLPA